MSFESGVDCEKKWIDLHAVIDGHHRPKLYKLHAGWKIQQRNVSWRIKLSPGVFTNNYTKNTKQK